ncbi:MAG TPA: MFS transporter, partial [Myxococcota bacterium]|nr:MFS transporter [Myxococcota bacterium]
FLLSLNLKQIQADLGIAESHLGLLAGLVGAGALFALPVTLAADRFGRRRMLLFTILGYTLCTGATALSPNTAAFVIFQLLARLFAGAESAIANVVIAEEFDARNRGWGIGALGALAACGGGLAALAFAFVNLLPFGWRSLYAIGLVPLGIVAHLRRTLPETARFDALERERVEFHAAPPIAPVRNLVRRYPGRLAMLAFTAFAIQIAMRPAVVFSSKFLQDVHGWSPGHVTLLTIVGGMVGIAGNSAAGWLSDRRGRRPVAVLFSVGMLVGIVCFYLLRSPIGPFFWILQLFGLSGTDVTLAAYGAEMFPTAVRSTASGVRVLCTTAGAVTGLALVSVLFGLTGSNWTAIAWLCAIGALSPLCVVALFPETAGRRLEEIAPEH